MPRKVTASLLVVCFCFSVYFAGCAQQADLSLKFAPDRNDTYIITTETSQSVTFSQPALDKIKKDETGTKIVMTVTQQFQSTDENGVSIVKFTLDDIATKIVDKTGVKFDYDSQRTKDKGKPFSKLLGKTYTLKITPDGKVNVTDAKSIRSAVTSGYDGRIAKSLFSDEGIIATHEILALPETPADFSQASEPVTFKVGDTWVKLKGSHPKLLKPKSFEKTYTITSIEKIDGKTVATVEMDAIESAVPAPDHPKSQGMGFMAKMFDTEETFTGILTFDVDSGKILSYDETLIGDYVAAPDDLIAPQSVAKDDEDSEDVEPDSLMMGFLHTVKMELVN